MGGPARIQADDRAGWVVVVDGHPQSHVHLDDPEHLAFEYVALIAAVVDALRPGPKPLRVTHVGGAGMTLPRWFAATRPGSPQVVLEPDGALTALVRRELPLPRGHRVRVREVAGTPGMAALRSGSADLVVLDAYADGRVPADLGALPFLTDCTRVLAPDGLLLANVADEPDQRYAARVAAGARAAFPGGGHTAYLSTSDVAKRRRFGNLVLVASAAPLDEFRLRRAAAHAPWPSVLTTEVDLARRHPGARPFTEADAVPSPTPPDPGREWRVR